MREKVLQRGQKIYDKYAGILFPLILLLYPLRHINVGVEWWDTGYNYGNFMYMDRMDPMWMFSTYLGNAVGSLLTRLPFGKYMLGMNFYTGLFVSLLALMGYFFFTRQVKLPAWIAFAGEILAVSLCWCPTALLYNYLTYVLMGIGVMLLYCALTQDKPLAFVGAGICLGINVFVRFPNLAEMALIVGVWAYGILCRTRFSKVLKQTLFCILGYVAGIGGGLLWIALRYGLGEYVSALVRLLSMPSEASDYTIYSMVIYQINNYQQNLIWLGYLALFTFLGILGFAVLPGKLERIKKLGYTACVFVGFYYLKQQKMFNMKYSTKLSVFQWSVFLLTATILIGVFTIWNRKAKEKDKLMLGLGILIIIITPLGSNNHLYSSINNLFFVAPFTLWMLIRLLKALPYEVNAAKWRLSTFPVRAMIVCMLFMLAVQSIGFGFGYVFSESDGGENLHTPIEKNERLKGMYTSQDRAEVLKSLSVYVQEENLAGTEVILYGYIPAMSYYLDMPFAITAWPDLRSYQYSVMEADLKKLSKQVTEGSRQLPVILLESGLVSEDGIPKDAAAQNNEDSKFALLMEWAKQYSYHVAFRNEKFVLLRADRGGEQ